MSILFENYSNICELNSQMVAILFLSNLCYKNKNKKLDCVFKTLQKDVHVSYQFFSDPFSSDIG